MTRNELLLNLYNDFTLMHAVWRSMARRHGVGAIVFFPEDYEKAVVLEQVRYRFWKAQDVSSFLKETWEDIEVDFAGDLDFMRYMNTEGFMALVVSDDHAPGEPGAQIHKVTRLCLN